MYSEAYSHSSLGLGCRAGRASFAPNVASSRRTSASVTAQAARKCVGDALCCHPAPSTFAAALPATPRLQDRACALACDRPSVTDATKRSPRCPGAL